MEPDDGSHVFPGSKGENGMGRPDGLVTASAAPAETLLSEMRRRLDEFDWAATALGPRARWSPALNFAVDLVLASGFPMVVRWGPELINIYNDAYVPLLGGKHPAAFGQPLRAMWPEIYERLGPLTEAILRGERESFFAIDHSWTIRRHGPLPEQARFTISYSPIPDPAAPHGIGGVLAVTVETTERVRNEGMLRVLTSELEAEVEERIRERDRIWRVSEDLLGVSNFEGYFVSVNPAWSNLLGWSEDEIKSMHVSALRHPDDAPASEAGRAQLASGVPTVRMENRFRHRDGSWRWIAWTMTADKGLIYVAGRHVTAERRAAEELAKAQRQLAQSQKMEALGQLTGGVAHDFNNLLMVVSGRAQWLSKRITEPQNVRALDAIKTAASRGESLTRQLLTFSRRQPLNPATVSPTQIVAAFRDVLSSSVRGNIELRIVIPDDIWPIAIDIAEFELALVNLVVNARDAIAESGTIVLSAENTTLSAFETAERLEGDFVVFTISDSGIGIPPDAIGRVFEPFFTTKSTGRGTGLGLSQVYGFARQSGGTATIASEVGRGTTVALYLPRSTKPVSMLPRHESTMRPEGHGEVILVVEDNTDVRATAIGLIEQLGYRTRIADAVRPALDMLASGAPIDLVFSDVVLPGDQDGLALAQIVNDRYPDIPVVLTSGYARRFIDHQGRPILRKPYDVGDLSRVLGDALAGRKLPAR
ncbi:MAG TPA: ATP-binding protein [Pseudolabrys sp.]|nr:ATP-binding protein [Pseudolabrys sp.]